MERKGLQDLCPISGGVAAYVKEFGLETGEGTADAEVELLASVDRESLVAVRGTKLVGLKGTTNIAFGD